MSLDRLIVPAFHNTSPSPPPPGPPSATAAKSMHHLFNTKIARKPRASTFSNTTNPFKYTAPLTTSPLLPPAYVPIENKALLSKIAAQFKMRIPLGTTVKNSVTYHGCFCGSDAVDVLCSLLKSHDRNLAILVGRALDAQRFFHHVEFTFRLRDSVSDLYVFPCNPPSRPLVFQPQEQAACPDPNSLTVTTITTKPRSKSISTSYETYANLHHSSPPPLPTGFFTPLSTCYSPTCTPTSVCYSTLCPNQFSLRAKLPAHTPPDFHSNPEIYDLDDDGSQCWSNIVPRALLDATSSSDIKRQEAIFELIISEESYVDDLCLVEKVFIEPMLRNSNLISPPERAPDLVKAVFGNILDIRDESRRFAAALVRRQQEGFVVHGIGDVCRALIPSLRSPLVKYASLHPWGKYHLDVETSMNPKLSAYLKSAERFKVARRLPIQSFLGRPLTRAGRYLLLLSAISKETDLDHPDQIELLSSMAEIRSILDQVNTAAGHADNAVRLLQLHQLFSYKSEHEMTYIGLQSSARRLVREGVLKRYPSSSNSAASPSAGLGSGGRDDGLAVLLLDHSIVLARRKHAKTSISLSTTFTTLRDAPVLEYHVHRSPIPLSLAYCYITDHGVASTSSNNINNYSLTSSAASLSGATSRAVHQGERNRSHSYSSLGKAFSTRSLSPERFRHAQTPRIDPTLVIGRRGRFGFSETLVASNLADRLAWVNAIQATRDAYITPLQKFKLMPVPEAIGIVLDGRPQTSAWLPMPGDEPRRLLVATDKCIFAMGQGRCERIVAVDKVTCMTVVEEQALILVLADRTLWGLSLASVMYRALTRSGPDVQASKLVSGISAFRVSYPPPSEITIQSPTSPSSFKVYPGFTKSTALSHTDRGPDSPASYSRTWVCTMKPSTMSSSIKVYEPVMLKSRHTAYSASGKSLARLFGFGHNNAKRDQLTSQSTNDLGNHSEIDLASPADTTGLVTALRIVRELYVPAEAISFNVLESKLFIGCGRGFEVLDPMAASIASLLDPEDPALDFIFDGRQGPGYRPMAVFLVPHAVGVGIDSPRYLLCYHHFALYVTADGRRARPDWWIEWDDEPKLFSVVCGIYIIAFSTKMIEIWDLETGSRVQSHSCDYLVVLDAQPDALICAVPVLQASALLGDIPDNHDWDSVTMVGSGTHFIFQLVLRNQSTVDT